MKNETRITITRNEGLETVVDKIIHAPTFAVVLVIPRESFLGHSVSNFNALKRESETAGKALMIESSDEHILELASRVKIPAENPPKNIKRPSMDIVRRAPDSVVKTKESAKSFKGAKSDEYEFSETSSEKKDSFEQKAPTFFKPIPPHARVDITADNVVVKEQPEPYRRKRPRKKVVMLVAGTALFLGIAWGAIAVLPRATITLFVKHTTVNSEDAVSIDKSAKDVSISNKAILIPAELFSEQGNLLMSFPANGTENVETKATGRLTVYNAYSVAPQPLIKSTRFESPDGKIFRLDKAVTIPGAKNVKGKLIPSKVEVSVTADKAGDVYNIQPANHWTIPGFKGTPRFSGFYADSLDAMAGGASGTRPTLSDADRASADNAVREALRSSLGMRILAMADKLKTFASSTSFSITKTEERMDETDKSKFGLYMEGIIKQLVFDEDMLKDAIVKKARTDDTASDDAVITRFDYGEPTFDFVNGVITVTVKSTVVFTPHIDLDAMKQNIMGNTKASAEATILAIPKLDSANIAFWPFWVNSVPSEGARIEMVVK